MSDSIETQPKNPYTVGTGVWVKVFSRIWWPGIVVDEETVPNDLKLFMKGIKNRIAVVKFEEEIKYEVVNKIDKILLYSCDRKKEFIEKGLALSKMQEKGGKIIGNCDMANFFKDIESMERHIGGDINIIENLKMEHLQQLEKMKSVKELFTPSSSKKSKKKVDGRKSLPASATPKPTTAPKSDPKPPKTSTSKVKKTATPVSAFRNVGISSPSGFTCHSKVGCSYTTNRYDILKRHMATHENEKDTKQKIVKKSPRSTSNKRKNLKTKSLDSKKQKIQDELLKDWENDGDDEDVVFVTSNVPTTTKSVQTMIEVDDTTNDTMPTICKPSTSAIFEIDSSSDENSDFNETDNTVGTTKAVENLNEVLSSPNQVVPVSTKVIPSTSKGRKGHLTNAGSNNKIFDFNDNDNNTPVVELRQSKSDCSSTVGDDMNETFEFQLTSEFVNKTIFEASPKKSLVVEVSNDDCLDKPHKIDSNKLTTEIDDQTKSTKLILENSGCTLNQINQLEESLSSISKGVNKSDSNVNVIDIHEDSSDCEFSKTPTSSNKDIQKKTNGLESRNSAIVEEDKTFNDIKRMGTDTIPNDKKINKDLSVIKNSSNLNDTDTIVIDSEDDNSTEDNLEPVLGTATKNDWIKQHGWETISQDELQQAKDFTSIGEVETKQMPNIEIKLESTKLLKATFPAPKTQVVGELPKTESRLISFRMEKKKPTRTLEELKADPVVQALQKLALEGHPIHFSFTDTPKIIKTSLEKKLVNLPPKPNPPSPDVQSDIIEVD